jgi:lysophospholipase L1-like esterase
MRPAWVLSQLPKGRKRLEISKRTGANFGAATFYGLRLDAFASLHKAKARSERKIEFLGDSLTNAYGAEGPGKQCPELRPYENAAKGFAALAAGQLGADLQVLALSGYGVVRNYGDAAPRSAAPFPLHYGRQISSEPGSRWDRSKFKPDAVVVNLGTNDFSTEPAPTEAEFIEAYLALIHDALQGRGAIPVFIASPKGRKIQELRCAQVVERAKKAGLDAQLVELEAVPESELGCDWHPLAQVHRRWAHTLASAMKRRLNW